MKCNIDANRKSINASSEKNFYISFMIFLFFFRFASMFSQYASILTIFHHIFVVLLSFIPFFTSMFSVFFFFSNFSVFFRRFYKSQILVVPRKTNTKKPSVSVVRYIRANMVNNAVCLSN